MSNFVTSEYAKKRKDLSETRTYYFLKTEMKYSRVISKC